MNKQQLIDNIRRKQSFLCVGLDTDIKKIPDHLLDSHEPIFAFNKAIIDATADLCVAYKPNLAFYECLGVKGWQALEKTVKYIRQNYPDQFIIADAKRGDIHHRRRQARRHRQHLCHVCPLVLRRPAGGCRHRGPLHGRRQRDAFPRL